MITANLFISLSCSLMWTTLAYFAGVRGGWLLTVTVGAFLIGSAFLGFFQGAHVGDGQ